MGIDLIVIKAFIEYGILGLLGYFYIKAQNKNTNMIQDEYKKLVDNLITTQDRTLLDLKKSIDKLTFVIEEETFHMKNEMDRAGRKIPIWSSD